MKSTFRAMGGRLATLVAGGVLLLAAPAAGAPELIGVGILPGDSTDLSGLTGNLGDGTPANLLGGLGSGIAYTGKGNRYIAVPDRGPANGTVNYLDRFQILDIPVEVSGSPAVKPSLVGTVLMKNGNGQNFTGLSSAFDATNSPNSLRLDPEAVRVSRSGSHTFVSDEYGPFVYEFDKNGNRVRAFKIPDKFLIANPNANGDNELPSPPGPPPGNSSGRQSNRGMEGLAITPDGTKLFGIMQSPLIQDGALNENNARRGINTRILELDMKTGATKEYLYQLSSRSNGVNEILAINDHEFLVIERDGNAGAQAAFKQIFHIDITGATDISNITLPQTGTPAGVTPVSKGATPFIDLLDPLFGLAGPGFPEKIEGLAFGPDLPDGRHLLLVTNDNDFISTQANEFFAFAVDPGDLPGFQPQAIPVPSSLLLVALGAVAAAAAGPGRRLRRNGRNVGRSAALPPEDWRS